MLLPDETISIIFEYIPLNTRVTNKKHYNLVNEMVHIIYKNKFDKIEKEKMYLNAMRIKPDYKGLNYIFDTKYKKGICGCLTRKKLPCRNKVKGINKCYVHRENVQTYSEGTYIIVRTRVNHLSLPNTMRLKIDPEDGLAYNYREFVDYYGGNKEWYSAKLLDYDFYVEEVRYQYT